MHGIESTAKIPLDRLPEPLRQEWALRANEGSVKVGLQDAYKLLESLKDPLGERFRNEKLDGPTSPLMARNNSVLAHGFKAVSKDVFEMLWKSALFLAEVEETALPSLMKLGSP